MILTYLLLLAGLVWLIAVFYISYRLR
jgi:hypothetical protein